MKEFALISLLTAAVLAAALAGCGATEAPPPRKGLPDMEEVAYLKCYDGDTCNFQFGNKIITVRLAGVDTPEIRGKCEREIRLALEAKGYLEWHLARARRIDLVEVYPDLRRLRARVMVDGLDIGARLVSTGAKRGFARPYNGKSKRGGWCE